MTTRQDYDKMLAVMVLEENFLVDTKEEAELAKEFYEASMFGHLLEVEDCIRRGVKVDVCGTTRYTALYAAAFEGHVEVCQALLDAGADVNFATIFGYTPLHAAASEGRAEVCKLLLEHGADVNATSNPEDDGYTPLHDAARYGWPEVCKLLLDYGADPTIKDALDETPAELAWTKGRDEAYEVIVAYKD